MLSKCKTKANWKHTTKVKTIQKDEKLDNNRNETKQTIETKPREEVKLDNNKNETKQTMETEPVQEVKLKVKL